jgi:predicted neutral ceramidase superfamily lipid hydrolase
VKLLNRIAVVKGSAVAIVICLPVTIVANVIHDDNPDSALLPLLFVLVAAGFGVGGFVAARSEGDAPISNGAFAALLAFVVIQAVAIVVHIVADESIHIGAIVGAALIAYAAGILGAALGRRRTATS